MCGREGTFFALERHVEHCKSNAWILNLYASEYGFAPGDDHEILMTIDHIIPLSRGGHPKHQDNMQTMCLHCNNFKASKAKFWKDINFEKVKHNNRIFRVPTNNPIRKEVPQ
jgi:5-methylcytosine-specific restriction endonuclease McrA